jgi:hypothetical protein
MLKCAFVGTATLLASATAAAADISWGVSGHPITAYPGVTIERQLDYVRDLGMKSYRVNIVDAETADVLARIVAEAKKRGIEVLPVITPREIDLDKDSPDEIRSKARALAVKLGTRFKDDIRAWELGNEVENYAIVQPCEKRDDGTTYPCEWGPAGGGSPLDYYGARWAKASAILKGLTEGMGEVDPGIRKAVGTAGWGHTGAFERMKQDGIEWDISVWHMYGEDPEAAFKVLAGYGKPIWVTELNNPRGSEISEREQAGGLLKSMKRLGALQDRYNVEAAHIYELLDETYWAPSFEASMGLVRLAGSAERGWSAAGPKTGYIAVRNFIRGVQPTPVPQRDCDLADGGQEIASVKQTVFAHCLILGRNPGNDEIDRWSTALEDGAANVPAMMIELMRSGEFAGKYSDFGLSDRAYISFLYRLLANREPDAHGHGTYAKQLREGTLSREAIALGMMGSSEFTTIHASHLNSDPAAALVAD